MAFTIAQIAQALGARAVGDETLKITHASEPSTASETAIALATNETYAGAIGKGQAKAAVLWDGADWESYGLKAAVYVERPRYAMAGLSRVFDPGPEIDPGIHETAVIHPDALIATNPSIGPFVVIGRGAKVGRNARIGAHSTIAEGAELGDDALLAAGSRIGAHVKIGDRTIIHAGAVIGSDGFSFVTPEKSGVEQVRETLGDRGETEGQSWTRIHSLGSVEIGHDVEIGANCAIDRGTVANTKIGNGTKLDNLVHVGHNVQVGEDTLLCGQVGIAGSARIGNRVVLGGQCGVSDNIFVGDDVIAGGATKIFTNAPKGRVLMGSPAMMMETHVEIYKALRRLPRLAATVAGLQKSVSKPAQND